MTKFTKTIIDITHYKPKMKPIYVTDIFDLQAAPFEAGKTTAQVKADGEFNLIHMDRHEIYAVNRFGRKTEDLPALKELHKLFLSKPLVNVDVLGEMYAVDENGKPLTLPTFIHYLKGGDESLHQRIHIGLFDIIQADGFSGNALETKKRFEMMQRNFDGKLCRVLEYIAPQTWEEVEAFYATKVAKEGWEGLVIRTNGSTYKAKPNQDVDAVIIGINHNTKGYEKGLAKSVKVALMRDDGNFVELGDATVASELEARELFALTRVKVGSTNTTTLVRPIVVVKINYISLFPDTINAVRDAKTLVQFGTTMLVRMKSPRVVGYRKDKHPCVEDIGLNQVGAE